MNRETEAAIQKIFDEYNVNNEWLPSLDEIMLELQRLASFPNLTPKELQKKIVSIIEYARNKEMKAIKKLPQTKELDYQTQNTDAVELVEGRAHPLGDAIYVKGMRYTCSIF